MPKLVMNGQLSSWGTVLGTLVVLLAGSFYWGSTIQAMTTRMEEGEKKDATQDEMIQALLAQQQAQHQAQQQAQQQLLHQSAMIEDIYKRGLIIPKGKAFVMKAPGDPYVELNILDTGASRLQQYQALKITNMSHPDRPVAIIKVGPVFTNATPDYVIQLSTEAGLLLHAQDGIWIQVRIEPVFKENGL